MLNSDLLEMLKTHFITRDELSIIGQTILTSSATSVTFSSIPQTFSDLYFSMQVRMSDAAESENLIARFNGDSASNYALNQLYGNNNLAASGVATSDTKIYVSQLDATNAVANSFSPAQMIVFGYARSDRVKWTLSSGGSFGNLSVASDFISLFRQNIWQDSSPITQVEFLSIGGGNILSGSIFRLYGIK